jgi:hypothetical protein
MKRLVIIVTVILILVAIAVVGCAEKEPAVTPEGGEVVSSCVSCHTDKDLLKEVASPEPEAEKSEATTGEG